MQSAFAKILTHKGSDQILGVALVAPHAGELLHEFVLAMNAGVGPGKIASMIHAYPLLLNSRPKPATNATWPA
jgi:pyruvate/2-oxoglutarate dehydrogenase complex dihydrolipoamide dehydrogenase (E3) component